MDKDLNFIKGSSDMLLENGDQVIVRSISGFEGIRLVKVEGEVIQPGNYTITNKAERISDVIKRAGGFTHYAYPLGAFLIRTENATGAEQRLNQITKENAKKIIQTKTDNKLDGNNITKVGVGIPGSGGTNLDTIQSKMTNSNAINKVFKTEGIVGINLAEIVKNPGGKYDFYLQEGDDIFVPRELQTVQVTGEVLFPTYVGFESGSGLAKYIDNAGGFSMQALKKKVFILYANGSARSTTSFLGIRFYPPIQPGCRIIVPEKPIEISNRMTTGEVVGMLASVTSAMALIYTLLK